MEGPNRPPGRPDNWHWLAVRQPDGHVHLYELGYPAVVDVLDRDGRKTGEADEAMSRERFEAVLAELGAPPAAELTVDGDWQAVMHIGRPNAYLAPKEYDEETGELLPIRAKPGVTLHLLEG